MRQRSTPLSETPRWYCQRSSANCFTCSVRHASSHEHELVPPSCGWPGGDGPSSPELLKRSFFQPTCNIASLTAGYQGPGSKTVLPRRASTKLDFRLVPNQRAEDILGKLREHLRREAYGDFTIRAYGLEEPYKTPFDAPIVDVVVETAEEIYGRLPVVLPTMAGPGPSC